MKSFIRNLILLSLIAAQAWSAVTLPPTLGTVQAKASYLSYVGNEIPWLFMEGAEYDVDLLDILEKQNLVVSQFQQDADYKAEMASRSGYMEWTVLVKEPRSVKILTPNQALISEVERNIQNSHLDYPEQIAMAVLGLSQRNSLAIRTGLINSLPKHERGSVFQMQAAEQLEYLARSSSLSDAVVRQNFRADTVGLTADQVTLSTLIQFAKEGQALEFKLVGLLLGYQLKSQSLTVEDLPKLISDWAWIGNLDLQGAKTESIRKTAQQAVKAYSQSSDTQKDHVISQLRIKEVPADLAQFRGIVGADCSTQLSGTVPFARKERTFYIYDEHDNLKGYAQGTYVQANGESYFYLHDVTGSRLSTTVMQQIFHVFQQSTEALGVVGILIPTAKRTHANNNYDHLRVWQMEIASLGTAVRVAYLDSDDRYRIASSGSLSNISYDDAKSNSSAHILNLPSDSKKYEIKYQVYDRKFELPVISNKEALFLYLVLSHGTASEAAQTAMAQAAAIADGGRTNNFSLRVHAAQQIAVAFGINTGAADRLVASLGNPNGYQLAEFYADIQRQFKALKVDFSEEDMKRFEYLFYEGHLNASDATTSSPENVRKTINYSLWLLKRWPSPAVVVRAVQANPQLFAESVVFQNYMKNLLTDKIFSLNQLEWLMNSDVLKPESLMSKNVEIQELLRHRDSKIVEVVKRIQQRVQQAEQQQGGMCAG